MREKNKMEADSMKIVEKSIQTRGLVWNNRKTEIVQQVKQTIVQVSRTQESLWDNLNSKKNEKD